MRVVLVLFLTGLMAGCHGPFGGSSKQDGDVVYVPYSHPVDQTPQDEISFGDDAQ